MQILGVVVGAANRRFIKVGKLSVNPYDIGVVEVVLGITLTLSGGTHSVCRYKNILRDKRWECVNAIQRLLVIRICTVNRMEITTKPTAAYNTVV